MMGDRWFTFSSTLTWFYFEFNPQKYALLCVWQCLVVVVFLLINLISQN